MNQVKQLINECKKYLTKYDYEKVIELCDEILKMQPESTFGLRFKGIALFQSGKYKESLDCYEKLYELSHDDDTTYTLARLNEKLGNCEKALEFYEKSPKSDKTISQRKRLLTKIKSYPLIITEYDEKLKELEVLDKSPENIKRRIVYLEEKGVFQYRNMEYDDAYETFKEVSPSYQNLDSKNTYHRKELDNWYNMLGEQLEKHHVPQDFFRKFFDLESNGKHWFNRIRYGFSDYEDSLVYSDLLLEMNPDNIKLLETCALKSKYIDDDYSIDCWKRILDIEPENTQAIKEILDMYCYQFSKDKSLKLINEKLYIDEIKLDLLERKIRLLESMTLYDEALSTYDKYLSINLEDDFSYNHLDLYDKIRCMEQKALESYLEDNLDESYTIYKKVCDTFQKGKDSGSLSSYMDKWYSTILKESVKKTNDDCITFFNEFFKLNEKTTELWIEKIKFLIDWKHFGNPIVYCNILLDKNDENIKVLVAKAYVYYRTKRLEKALELYNVVLKIDSYNDEAKNHKFNILIQWEKYMEAYELLRTMIVDYPVVNNNLYTLANALMEEKKYDKALFVYKIIYIITNRVETIDKIKFLQNRTGKTELLHNSPYYLKWIDLINNKYESDKCPTCGNELTEILYGLPTKEAMESADKGEIVLGGCCISDDSPTHYCKHCLKYVHMGTYMIDIADDDKELSSYTRGNIHWITEYIFKHPKNNMKKLEEEAFKIGMDSRELMKFIEKLEEIGHIKRYENSILLVE